MAAGGPLASTGRIRLQGRRDPANSKPRINRRLAVEVVGVGRPSGGRVIRLCQRSATRRGDGRLLQRYAKSACRRISTHTIQRDDEPLSEPATPADPERWRPHGRPPFQRCPAEGPRRSGVELTPDHLHVAWAPSARRRTKTSRPWSFTGMGGAVEPRSRWRPWRPAGGGTAVIPRSAPPACAASEGVAALPWRGADPLPGTGETV